MQQEHSKREVLDSLVRLKLIQPKIVVHCHFNRVKTLQIPLLAEVEACGKSELFHYYKQKGSHSWCLPIATFSLVNKV